jgi:demethylspheroidene O-methyltransferase
VLDLPPVAARARAHFARAGLEGRARAVAGDMLDEALPRGADVASLVRVLHDHDDAQALALLGAARAALPSTGRLLIAEPMAATPGAEPAGAAYFGMYLWAMGSGRPRSAAELTAMAREAGFTRCREFRTRQPLLVRVLVAAP